MNRRSPGGPLQVRAFSCANLVWRDDSRLRMAANIHPVPRRERRAGPQKQPTRDCKVRVTGQFTRTIGAGELRVRTRLRLILGMRLLERLALHPLPVGQRLPSIRAVAAASGVHRNTAAAAYADLARLGLIRCEVGSGSFASLPPIVRPDIGPSPIQCREPELARLLSAELRRTPSTSLPGCEAHEAGPVLLHPLDLIPKTDVASYPVAPVGETLAQLRALRSGSTAIVVSKSPSARRLMRSAIGAVHGNLVGVVSLKPDDVSPDLIAQRTGDLPAILFHDADWSHGLCEITSCILRLLKPGRIIRC